VSQADLRRDTAPSTWIRLDLMGLWTQLQRRDPTFRLRHRKLLLSFSAGLALCYLVAGVFGFLLGHDLFFSVGWTTLGAVWAGITACYWFQWPRRSFSAKEAERHS
jgi:hypothetical protein